MAKKRERKLTITQQIMQIAIEKLAKYQNDVTRKMYTCQFKSYVKFCREHFNVRTLRIVENIFRITVIICRQKITRRQPFIHI